VLKSAAIREALQPFFNPQKTNEITKGIKILHQYSAAEKKQTFYCVK
jgi:hypothetical protein